MGASVLVLAAVGAITSLVAWTRVSRRQQRALVARVDAIERRLAEHPAGTDDSPKAQAPDEGLPVGAPAPGPAALAPSGRPALILFVSSGCPPCAAALSQVAIWRDQFGEVAGIAVVSRDEEDGMTLAEAYRARWTPAGVLVGGTGRIASPLRHGTDGVRDLMTALGDSIVDGAVDERVLHRRLGARLGHTSLIVGDSAPASRLFDAGAGETLVIFWDPACGYCQKMAAELTAIDAAPPPGAPRMTFVVPRDAGSASGPHPAFSSPSVFDPESRIAPLFGARGTPSAVLIDRDGRIASTVAVGKDAILSLLAAR